MRLGVLGRHFLAYKLNVVPDGQVTHLFVVTLKY